MRVCVVGSGAREHALAHTLAQTADVIVTPGNPGITGVSVTGHTISSSPLPVEQIASDLVVVGPEAPLVDGLADRLRAVGTSVFGPGADGARLEGSKAYMKSVAEKARVPSARFGIFDAADEALSFLASLPGPYVIKTDGLAVGKGVLVTPDIEEASADVLAKLDGTAFGSAGRRIVIEEAMFGQELSLLVVCDGKRAIPLPPAQDFKRLLDGDGGPNTGGMGAYSPVPFATDAIVGQIMDQIVEPTLSLLGDEGIDYRGILYAGLMLTEEGPKLIEYNVRLGDPEAEVVLPRLDGDLAETFLGAANGNVPDVLRIRPEASVCVVMATNGYPTAPVLGNRISGLAEASTVEGVTVFHGGTIQHDGIIEVAGGRVVTVSALGKDIAEARRRAYAAVDRIQFDGAQYRHDIAEAVMSDTGAVQE